MPHFFLNKRLIILLIGIIILVSLIGFSLRDRDNISRPEQFVKDVVGFGQSLVAKPAHKIAGFFGDMKELQNTYTENKKLKVRLEDVARLEKENVELKKENAELREALDKKESLRDFTPIQATVISRTPDRWYERIIIDKGKKSGIKPDMAVITSKGLVGRVISTSEMTSTIELLSSDNTKNRVAAFIQAKSSVHGLIAGYDRDKKMLLMKDLPIDEEKIKKGQSVKTSGLGGIFPKGLDIGTVEEIVLDQFGLSQTAYIKPSAEFYDFEHVMVVARSMHTGDNKEEE
ncbi:rod shape-determining protein MreC [Siminovitchia sp. 179-K 8D1 HS]|uniref:rod shape-determining protein MreC n=1 Tax=Siminovitchia sp. 179-K 8D1 HS TaxID=3142385 RepID=UPI0039A1FAAF